SAMRAAAVLRATGHDAVAGGTEDTRPPGQQPGQVRADQMLVVGGVEELDPLAGEIEVHLFGAGGGRSVHDDADLGAATHLRQRTRAVDRRRYAHPVWRLISGRGSGDRPVYA